MRGEARIGKERQRKGEVKERIGKERFR